MSRQAHKALFVGCFLLPALALGPACSGGGSDTPEVAAEVGDREVTTAAVERLTKSWMSSQVRQGAESQARTMAEAQAGRPLPGPGEKKLSEKQVRRLVLAFLIRRALLDDLAAARQIKVQVDPQALAAAQAAPDADLAATGWGREEIEGSFKAGELSKALAAELFPSVAVSEAELRQRYEAQPDVFAKSWKISVQSATFRDEKLVADLQAAVKAGEAFNDAAGRLGALDLLDLGTINSLRTLPQPIREALEGLAAGTVSGPVRAGDGFVTFYAQHREDLPALSFDEARPGLEPQMADEKRQELFDGWFDKQLRKARVEVDEHFGRWDPKSSQVV